MTGVACEAGNDYPVHLIYTSGFYRGSCCPVVCVSLFHVIVLSFVFLVLIVPLAWLRGISLLLLSFWWLSIPVKSANSSRNVHVSSYLGVLLRKHFNHR